MPLGRQLRRRSYLRMLSETSDTLMYSSSPTSMFSQGVADGNNSLGVCMLQPNTPLFAVLSIPCGRGYENVVPQKWELSRLDCDMDLVYLELFWEWFVLQQRTRPKGERVGGKGGEGRGPFASPLS